MLVVPELREVIDRRAGSSPVELFVSDHGDSNDLA